MTRMGMTIKDFMENGGWSAEHFVEHAKYIFPKLSEHDISFIMGRHVLHLVKNDRKLKLYPHYKGRTNDYMTVTEKRKELKTFEKSCEPHEILTFILETFDIKLIK